MLDGHGTLAGGNPQRPYDATAEAAGQKTAWGSAGNTVPLSEAFVEGRISAVEYADQRARLVGKPNLVSGVLSPLLELIHLA